MDSPPGLAHMGTSSLALTTAMTRATSSAPTSRTHATSTKTAQHDGVENHHYGQFYGASSGAII
eukprot:7469435-Pyramimonas_sp.AAC.1